MYHNRKPDHCPGNPEHYIWVNAREGGYWRRRRGMVKIAELNASLRKNAHLTQPTNEAASRIMGKLEPYLNGIHRGRSFSYCREVEDVL